MSRLKGQLADPLLSVVLPAYNEEVGGMTRARRSPGATDSSPCGS